MFMDNLCKVLSKNDIKLRQYNENVYAEIWREKNILMRSSSIPVSQGVYKQERLQADSDVHGQSMQSSFKKIKLICDQRRCRETVSWKKKGQITENQLISQKN